MSKATTAFCNRDGGFSIVKYEGLKVKNIKKESEEKWRQLVETLSRSLTVAPSRVKYGLLGDTA